MVLSAILRLPRADDAELERARETYRANLPRREQRYPAAFPNCGSVFKNLTRRDEIDRIIEVWPDVKALVEGDWHGKVSVGYVIHRPGLAGCRVGGAQISQKHGNFIVNFGGNRFSDVYALIEKVGEVFDHRFGFVPEPEVESVRRSLATSE